MDDRELIEAALTGDDDAYGTLVRRYQDVAFRAAFLVTRSASDAEEACQEGFVKAHRSLARFRLDEPFRPWLLRIVTNQAKNRRRSAGRRQGLALRAGATTARLHPGPEDEIIAEEERQALLVAMETLPKRDQDVVAYRYFLELSVAETASALGVAQGTVKSRLSRALARLEDLLSKPPTRTVGEPS